VNVKPVAVATGVVAVGTTESLRSITADVAADNAADEAPMLFVAITDTLMNLSISASVKSYVLSLAEVMLLYVPFAASARFHWYV
jgi:hypothetical protein